MKLEILQIIYILLKKVKFNYGKMFIIIKIRKLNVKIYFKNNKKYNMELIENLIKNGIKNIDHICIKNVVVFYWDLICILGMMVYLLEKKKVFFFIIFN